MDKSRIGLNSSFTKDEAIALLIGLGDKRFSPIAGSKFEDSFWLYEYLYEESDRLENACKFQEREEESEEILIEKFENHNKLIKIAEEYLCRFDHELSLGESSMLKKCTEKMLVDPNAEHYTIISIQQWAIECLGLPNISLGDFLQGNFKLPEATNPVAQLDTQLEDPTKSGSLSPTKGDNLYTAFAYLVDAFSARSAKYRSMDKKKLNVSATAEGIETFIRENSKDGNPTGQSHESIKTHIEAAMRIRKLKLPTKD